MDIYDISRTNYAELDKLKIDNLKYDLAYKHSLETESILKTQTNWMTKLVCYLITRFGFGSLQVNDLEIIKKISFWELFFRLLLCKEGPILIMSF